MIVGVVLMRMLDGVARWQDRRVTVQHLREAFTYFCTHYAAHVYPFMLPSKVGRYMHKLHI